jgi:ABC-type uncharacterized transport system permease subunit
MIPKIHRQKPCSRSQHLATRLFAVCLLLLPAITASAEAGKSIKMSDIVLFLVLAIVIFFGWHLLVAYAIFYFGNRRGRARRKNIWGTYGMSLLGSILGFAMMRNGPEGHYAVLFFTIVTGIAGGFAGYAVSPKANEKDT